MKLLPRPMKALFALQSYLWQMTHSTTETSYSPYQFWRFYRKAHLERCWNWKEERVERLERCWQKEWNPSLSTFQPRCDRPLNRVNQQSIIELKWRGVSYYRPAIDAVVTQLVKRSANDSEKLPTSDDQLSPHLSQISPQT